MNIVQLKQTPVCFGVGCEKHHLCQRYEDVNGSSSHGQQIGFCEDEHGERLLFVPLSVVRGDA